MSGSLFLYHFILIIFSLFSSNELAFQGLVCRQQYSQQQVFSYQNPIRNGIDKGMRDCQVIVANGKYYLVGTSHPFWYWHGNKNPGVKIYSSDDLLNWKFEKLLIDRSKLDSTVWYLDRFWAPEIHHIRGKYYLSFNCQNESTDGFRVKGQHAGLAVSDEILADYKVLTHNEPLTHGNDLTLFEDADNKVYAFFNRDKKIFSAEIDLETIRFVNEPAACIEAGKLEYGDWDGIGIEGAYCIKVNGRYFLLYSSWSRGYEIGYATANHPLGPWTKHDSNPIYGAQSESMCDKNKLAFTGDEDSPWAAVGHNQIFTGPDGRLWSSCHGSLKEDPVPYLVIDPVSIHGNELIINGPTHTLQEIEF